MELSVAEMRGSTRTMGEFPLFLNIHLYIEDSFRWETPHFQPRKIHNSKISLCHRLSTGQTESGEQLAAAHLQLVVLS
jgi:hypothetical protein